MTRDNRHAAAEKASRRREDPWIVFASLPGSYFPTVVDLSQWPCDGMLKEQLADAIEALTGVTGSWRTARTARGSAYMTKYFAKWCSENEVKELVALTPDRWNSYLLSVANSGMSNTSQRRQLGAVRQVLRQYLNRLHPDLPKHLNRRLPTKDGAESQPFSIDEYDAIIKAATAAVTAEYQRIHPNVALLERRAHGRITGGQLALVNALHEIATTGEPQSEESFAALDMQGLHGTHSGPSGARPRLFVSREGAVAIAVLIACLEGANFTTINERKVPTAAPGLGVAEDIWTVEDEKRRRHGHAYDAHAIPKNARRSMSRIIEMTQPGRDYLLANNLPGADRLIVYWPAMGRRDLIATPSVGVAFSDVHRKHRLSWWPSENIPISFNRIRKTVRVLIDRSPQGHSRTTWSTLYVGASVAERERLMTEAVETGLWSVITNAESYLRMRYERITSGADSDTVIAGCRDWKRHPLTGQPCGDDFLLCLQCTNAFATPRHLPRLIELRHQLEAIASTDGPDWTDFRATAYGCLVALLDDRSLITPDEYHAANCAVTEEDRAEIRLLLNGRYT